MSKPVIGVFDIGKTNKKLFVFDTDYQIVYETASQFTETSDDDGDACEDLSALTSWVREAIRSIATDRKYDLKALNFSTYGASFVHVNREGRPITPLYNYLKPFPESLKARFYEQYGSEFQFSLQTASPALGNLNSGLQLYFLKHQKPEVFDQIHASIHLPQYMSSLVTGRMYSDITSIGCHTGMWNFIQNHYHEWLSKEGIASKLAPIFPSDQLISCSTAGRPMLCGVGLHDSSAALIPYLSSFSEPFLLISTGTWCISLNPFNQTRLTEAELKADCLAYMEYRGKPVKASRLFAGNEHEQQIRKLADHFHVDTDRYKSVSFNPEIVRAQSTEPRPATRSKDEVQTLRESVFSDREMGSFLTYEEGYHQLIADLVEQQVESTNLVLKGGPVKRIFVDGGFGKNDIYMQLLAQAYPEIEVYAASVAQASAIGAALAVHRGWNAQPVPDSLIDLKYYSTRSSTPQTVEI